MSELPADQFEKGEESPEPSEPEPSAAPLGDSPEDGMTEEIPGPPEPQEPDLPPLDESEPEEPGDGGGEGSPEDSSEKPESDSPDKTPRGAEGREGSVDGMPGSAGSEYERFKQSFKEAAGRDIGSNGVGDRPLDVPLGPTLRNQENPLFRLKDAVEVEEVRGGRELS